MNAMHGGVVGEVGEAGLMLDSVVIGLLLPLALVAKLGGRDSC